MLCGQIGGATLTPAEIAICTLNGGVLLNDALSLAHYNLADQTQLIFSSLRKQ